jgi:hypothetical protein
MDPVTVALLSGALGGASGEAVRGIWEAAGRRWFDRYFTDHAPAAVAAGETNTIEFLSHLALRVESLESTAPAALKAGLSDPDFAQTLRAALLAAARTSDATKRSVLARAISERLAAGAESPEAAIATMAVAAVPTLGRRHLEILGTLAVLHAVRPEGLPLPQSPPEGG